MATGYRIDAELFLIPCGISQLDEYEFGVTLVSAEIRSPDPRPYRPVDQLDSQLLDHLAGSRLGNAILRRRPGETLLGDDITEHFEGLDMHTDTAQMGELSTGPALGLVLGIQWRIEISWKHTRINS